MKTGLFDRNERELEIGDKYKAYRPDSIYTVFWKNGAICGGKTIETCEPLGWEIEEGDDDHPANYGLIPAKNLDWMEIITTNQT